MLDLTIFAVTIAIYVPVILSLNRICFKYGWREEGWLLLVIFSLFQIASGALGVANEKLGGSALRLGCSALKVSGVSPLLLGTLGLIKTIVQGPDGEHRHARKSWPLYIVGMAALILAFVGVTSHSRAAGTAGWVLFAGLYVILVAITLLHWSNRHRLMKYRKQLLVVVTAALPFLAVRVLYSILSAFSSKTTLPEFGLEIGNWKIYVVMVVAMEYAVVLIYTIAGNVLPLNQDYLQSDPDEFPLYHSQY